MAELDRVDAHVVLLPAMASQPMTQSASSERRGIWPVIEAGVAVAIFVWLVANPGIRALLAGCVRAIFDGARSTALLVPIDPATLLTGFAATARVALMLAPPARMLARSPRHRLAWAPLILLVWTGVLGVSVPALHSLLTWAIFVAAAGAAWIAAPRRWLSPLAFLPWVVALEPMLGHSPLGDSFWPPSRLDRRCAENDGKRPVDLRPEYEVSRYYAVTPATDEWLLLTGERGSFWARRGPDGAARLGSRLRFSGNLWQGCVRDGRVWITSRSRGLCEAAIPSADGAVSEPICHKAPGSPALGVEMDYVDAICPPDRPTVYSSQLLRGGYLELDPRTDETKWHAVVPGLNLQMVARRDGKLLAITTGRFVVFDPDTDRVLEEHPAGTVALGIDVCSRDDAVAVTDFAGRIRLFERGADGRYRLGAAAFARAPRRVAFSPSCEHVVVTSGDDRHAFLLRRRDLATLRTWRLGPGLRDVVFADERTVAAADACTVNLLDVSP